MDWSLVQILLDVVHETRGLPTLKALHDMAMEDLEELNARAIDQPGLEPLPKPSLAVSVTGRDEPNRPPRYPPLDNPPAADRRI